MNSLTGKMKDLSLGDSAADEEMTVHDMSWEEEEDEELMIQEQQTERDEIIGSTSMNKNKNLITERSLGTKRKRGGTGRGSSQVPETKMDVGKVKTKDVLDRPRMFSKTDFDKLYSDLKRLA